MMSTALYRPFFADVTSFRMWSFFLYVTSFRMYRFLCGLHACSIQLSILVTGAGVGEDVRGADVELHAKFRR